MKTSSKLPQKINLLILAGFTILVLAIFLFLSKKNYGIGFPLDDAWIHQTYARNLATRGEWSFIVGKPTAGSTSPLWTGLISVGYLIKLNMIFWTFFIGGLCLFLLGYFGERVFRVLNKNALVNLPLMGVILVGEWHFIWAAVSGMETILMSVLVGIFFYLILRDTIPWFWAGILIGIGVWVRPDAITLLGPLGFMAITRSFAEPRKISVVLSSIIGFLFPFFLYLLFNQRLQGTWWPNTFYAKQMEYQSLLETPILYRFFNLLKQPCVGVGALLVPGFIYRIWQAIHTREWSVISMAIWWIGFNMLYTARLPVVYQHARYLIPSMVAFFLIAGSGCSALLEKMKTEIFPSRIIKQAWIAGIAAVWLVFIGMGANAYSMDVAIIESEMVTTSKWIRDNTNPEDVIAAHDIGALGYFGNRDILDLAGLISPEVIPFIRDEAMLEKFIFSNDASYLMTFPGWYPKITENLEAVFKTESDYSPRAGGENMAVFRIP